MKREIPEPWATAMVAAGITDPRNGARPSWSELGRRINVHPSTLIAMADGSRETSQTTVNAVADELRVSRNDVAGWVKRSRSETSAYQPPPEADLLDRDERKAVDQIIALLARSKMGGTGVATQLRRGVGVAEVTQTFKDRDETATEPAGVSGSRSDDQADTLGPNLGGGAVILGGAAADDPNIGVQGSAHDTEDREIRPGD